MKFVNLDESEIIEQPLEKVIARPDYSPIEFVYDDLCSLDSVSVDGIHPSGDDSDLILPPSINKINNCFKSEYFKISNLFSEIQTYEQKQEALKNLGISDAINDSSYIYNLGKFNKSDNAEEEAIKIANNNNIAIILYYVGNQNGIIFQQVGDSITKQILLWDNTIFQRYVSFSDSSKTHVSSISSWWKLGATHISYDSNTRKFHLQDMNYKNLNPTVDSEVPLASSTLDGFMSKELVKKLESFLSTLSTKLDALSPGDGITMMNNTVSTLIGNGLTYNGREIVINHDLTLKTNDGKLGVNAGKGLYVNPDNELGINIGKGLAINHTDSTVEVAEEVLNDINTLELKVKELDTELNNKIESEPEFKDGLDVVGSVVSVNVGEDTTSNKNFLDMEDDSDGNKALAVRSIDTDSTILQKDIVVAGMSGQFGAGNYENNDVIPAGTDIYTILQNILCKELYPTDVKSTQGNITSSVDKPTIDLSQSGTVTYGTPCTLNSVTCGKLNVTPSASKVTGLTWGYSSADDDSADSTGTTITKNVTSSITDATYDLAVSFTGFNGQTSITATSESKDECKIESTALGFITMGDNKISVTQTGPAVKGEIEKIESGYTVSNLGNTDASKKYDAVAALSKQLDRPTSSNNKTITGVLPCFYNLSNGTLVDDATVQMSLITGSTFTDISVPSEGVAKKHFMFDFPADRTVSTFKVKDLQGNYVTFEAAYTQNTEVEKVINGIKMNYKRLQTTGDFVGDGVYRIELNKNLNTATINDVVKNN